MASFIARSGPQGRRVWQAYIRRRGYPAQIRTFDSKTRAEIWARQIEAEMDRGAFVSRAEAESTTLADALARYQKEISSKKRGRVQESSVIASLSNSPLGRRSIGSIRGIDLAKYRDALLADGYNPITIKRRLAVLSHLYKVAVREWGIGGLTNPVPHVSLAVTNTARTRRLIDDEESRLLEATKTYGGEIGPLITWAIETAMRRGEIAAMRWEHLDRKHHVLLVPETKTGTPRKVPLSSRALGVLDDLPRRLDGRVWSMRPDSITHAFAAVCTAAGIEGLIFHDLRHEATSRLFEKGLNPMEVAAITGHKTLQMLKRYTHLRAEDLVGRLG